MNAMPTVRHNDTASELSVQVRTIPASKRRSGSGSPASDEDVEWDRFVADAGGTAFHRLGFLRATTDTLGHPAFALAARDATGGLRGVLPLVHVRSRLFGSFLVGVPFASYGGPLGDPQAIEALIEAAVALSQQRGAGLLELRSRHAVTACEQHLAVSWRKTTVTLSLEGGSAATFSRFPAKLRSQIRRGQKEGIRVHVAAQQVQPFYRVFSEHMRDLGTPALPINFFHSLAEEFGDDMLFAIASLNGSPIACGAGFLYDSEFEITWASALRAYSRIAPNMAMYWGLMEHVADRGVPVFNFGRCTVDSGTHRFKKQWGGVDEPLPWYQWHAGDAPIRTPAPGGKFALAEAVWRHLPLAIAGVVGPRIARLLP